MVCDVLDCNVLSCGVPGCDASSEGATFGGVTDLRRLKSGDKRFRSMIARTTHPNGSSAALVGDPSGNGCSIPYEDGAMGGGVELGPLPLCEIELRMSVSASTFCMR